MIAMSAPTGKVSNLGVAFDFLDHTPSCNRRLITDGFSLFAMQYSPGRGQEYRGRIEIGRWDPGGSIPRVLAPQDDVVRGVKRSHVMYEEMVQRLFFRPN